MSDYVDNNYAYSSIRAWLNDTFYNTAFNEYEKAIINTVEVDNSARSTNPDNSAKHYNSGTNNYACENTYDKVWLLSEQEVTTAAYGFNTSPGNYDTVRRKQGTDYAKSQGLWVYRSSSSVYNGNSYWWLRSPYCENNNDARGVNYAGNAEFSNLVYSTSDGVVPALQITLA